jgi:hypothetical protein
MKIRPPVPGRTTATLVAYKYDKAKGRTVPVRLGSFNVAADPDALPAGVHLAKDVALDFATIQSVRDYLLANRPPKFDLELVAQCRADIEAEVREEVTAQIAHERATEPQDPLELVDGLLHDAGAELVRRARQMSEAGHKLTSQRSQATSAAADANPLDMLQAAANHIRRELFARFEAACKEAGLMVKKGVTH